MPKSTNAQIDKATKLFFANDPTSLTKVLAITQADADILGTTLEELRRVETFAAIDRYARARRQDPTELLLTLAANGPEEFEQMWSEH